MALVVGASEQEIKYSGCAYSHINVGQSLLKFSMSIFTLKIRSMLYENNFYEWYVLVTLNFEILGLKNEEFPFLVHT